MTVTFCGHAEIYYDITVEKKLYDVIEKMINEGADKFLLGGYGKFDILAAKTLAYAKRKKKNIVEIK